MRPKRSVVRIPWCIDLRSLQVRNSVAHVNSVFSHLTSWLPAYRTRISMSDSGQCLAHVQVREARASWCWLDKLMVSLLRILLEKKQFSSKQSVRAPWRLRNALFVEEDYYRMHREGWSFSIPFYGVLLHTQFKKKHSTYLQDVLIIHCIPYSCYFSYGSMVEYIPTGAAFYPTSYVPCSSRKGRITKCL